MGEESEGRKFQFLRNGDAEPSDFDWSKGIESARQVISEAMPAGITRVKSGGINQGGYCAH